LMFKKSAMEFFWFDNLSCASTMASFALDFVSTFHTALKSRACEQ